MTITTYVVLMLSDFSAAKHTKCDLSDLFTTKHLFILLHISK